MTWIFRQIKNRQSWDKSIAIDGIKPDETPADVLNSFNTDRCVLSIYLVEDVEASLQRLAAAFCAKREKVQHLDYVLIKSEDLDGLDIELRNVAGEVFDAEVSSWHRDIVSLDVRRCTALALRMYERGEAKRMMPKTVGRLVNASLKDGRCRADLLNPKLVEELKNKAYSPVV